MPMENSSVSNLAWQDWLLVWVITVIKVMCDESQEAKQMELSYMQGKCIHWPESHGICTNSGGGEYILVL